MAQCYTVSAAAALEMAGDLYKRKTLPDRLYRNCAGFQRSLACSANFLLRESNDSAGSAYLHCTLLLMYPDQLIQVRTDTDALPAPCIGFLQQLKPGVLVRSIMI